MIIVKDSLMHQSTSPTSTGDQGILPSISLQMCDFTPLGWITIYFLIFSSDFSCNSFFMHRWYEFSSWRSIEGLLLPAVS